MKIIQNCFWVTIISLGMIFSSYAETLPNQLYLGKYVSVNVGSIDVSKIYDAHASNSGLLGAGGSLFLGNRVSTYFAPELDFGYFSFGTDGGVGFFNLNGKFILPVGSCMSVFGKLGLGYAEVITRLTTRVAKNGFVPSFGVGFSYGFTPSSTITAQINSIHFSNGFGNATGLMNMFTIGYTYYHN